MQLASSQTNIVVTYLSQDTVWCAARWVSLHSSSATFPTSTWMRVGADRKVGKSLTEEEAEEATE